MLPATKRCNDGTANGGACDFESPLEELPPELRDLMVDWLLLPKCVLGKKALVMLSDASHEWKAKVRGLLRMYKPCNVRRVLRDEEDAETRACIKFDEALFRWSRQPSFFSGLSTEAAAFVVGPASAWDEAPEDYESVMREQEDRLTDFCELLAHAPLEVIAFAACDMSTDQRRFFFGQYCGEWRIDYHRYIDVEGAAKLGKLLGSFPLLTEVGDLFTLLDNVEDIQNDKDRAAALMRRNMRNFPEIMQLPLGYDANGRPSDEPTPTNLPLALLASWFKTPLGKPNAWNLKPAEPFQSWDGFTLPGGNTEFTRVLEVIRTVLPSEVAAQREERWDALHAEPFETDWETPATIKQLVAVRKVASRCISMPAFAQTLTTCLNNGHFDAIAAMPDHLQRVFKALVLLYKAVSDDIREMHGEMYPPAPMEEAAAEV